MLFNILLCFLLCRPGPTAGLSTYSGQAQLSLSQWLLMRLETLPQALNAHLTSRGAVFSKASQSVGLAPGSMALEGRLAS